MGSVFRRHKDGPWYLKYRAWDAVQQKWGDYKRVSSESCDEKTARTKLREIEAREEQRKAGVLVPSSASIASAIDEFLSETQVWDSTVPERNRRGVHPADGREVAGKSWWIRKLDFARDAIRFFERDQDVKVLGAPGHLIRFEAWLAKEGGAKGSGVDQSTRHKVMVWLRSFARWCVARGYLPGDPFVGFKMPGERVDERARVLSKTDEARFWEEYDELSLMAKVRVGLVLATGGRAGEIETIRVKDVGDASITRQVWKRSGVTSVTTEAPAGLMRLIRAWVEARGLTAQDRLLPIRSEAGRSFLRRWRTSLRGCGEPWLRGCTNRRGSRAHPKSVGAFEARDDAAVPRSGRTRSEPRAHGLDALGGRRRRVPRAWHQNWHQTTSTHHDLSRPCATPRERERGTRSLGERLRSARIVWD